MDEAKIGEALNDTVLEGGYPDVEDSQRQYEPVTHSQETLPEPVPEQPVHAVANQAQAASEGNAAAGEVRMANPSSGNAAAGEVLNIDEETRKLQEEERKKVLKRKNSREWHAKYVSKRVFREQATPQQKPDTNKNMHTACVAFVSRWIQESGMAPSNERRASAYKAWMASEERAALLASKSGVQM